MSLPPEHWLVGQKEAKGRPPPPWAVGGHSAGPGRASPQVAPGTIEGQFPGGLGVTDRAVDMPLCAPASAAHGVGRAARPCC